MKPEMNVNSPLTAKEYFIGTVILFLFFLVGMVLWHPVVVTPPLGTPVIQRPMEVKFPEAPAYTGFLISHPKTGYPGIARIDQRSGEVEFIFWEPLKAKKVELQRPIGTPNPNPVILDSSGEATVILEPGIAYKFRFYKPGHQCWDQGKDVEWEMDNVTSVKFSAEMVPGKTKSTFFTKDGRAAAGYVLCSFKAGTSIPWPTYSSLPSEISR